VHFDLRADNLILGRDGGVHVVDWAHACTGPACADLSILLTQVEDPGTDEILAGAPPEGVAALWCAFAGLVSERCRRPAPPGPTAIRACQRAYARSLIDRPARSGLGVGPGAW
jgi:aminoglycoside phosphotransferase (APT) family kinase protein